VPRVFAIWLMFGAAVTLAAGCAGNTASASDTASKPAQVGAFAGEVNLRASDIPGFKVVGGTVGEQRAPPEQGAPPGPVPRRAEECDGGPLVNEASRGVASSLLQKSTFPIQTVLSVVYPMRDPSVASAYVAATDSRTGLDCIQREEVRKRDAARIHSIKSEVVALDRPLPGVPVSGIRIWRCLVTARTCKSSLGRSFTDRLWFTAGRYVVALVFIAGPRNEAKGPKPLALPLERQLIALLYRRARAHKP
jgi:hypothetical protein